MEFTKLYGKNNKVIFDLRKGAFFARKKGGCYKRPVMDADVGVTIGRRAPSHSPYVSFSINSRCNKRVASFKRIIAGIVKQNGEERLYLIDGEDGFAVTQQKDANRRFARVTITDSDKKVFERYIGYHNFKYDTENKEYYITAEE